MTESGPRIETLGPLSAVLCRLPPPPVAPKRRVDRYGLGCCHTTAHPESESATMSAGTASRRSATRCEAMLSGAISEISRVMFLSLRAQWRTARAASVA
jgi:hypothetical protein